MCPGTVAAAAAVVEVSTIVPPRILVPPRGPHPPYPTRTCTCCTVDEIWVKLVEISVFF